MADKNVLDLDQVVDSIGGSDPLAGWISNIWQLWKGARQQWENEVKERRNFVFATDTTKTSTSHLPWKNKTTLPKLTQLRDNLHANYMAALFPHEDWFEWMPMDEASAEAGKAKAIKAYIKNKIELSGFRDTVSKLVLDYIDYGNAFAEVVYIDEQHILPDGTPVGGYQGPKLHRISPFDLMFDITARDFKSSPVITRRLLTLGQLRKTQKEQADAGWIEKGFTQIFEFRKYVGSSSIHDTAKSEGLQIDGFSDANQYLGSGMVEILEFEGDYYDVDKDELVENRRVIVADRYFILLNEAMPSWFGKSNKEHVGWRQRPDNLMAMGPLDNLVGLQYRMDHLENLRADVFDQIAHPVVYQRGYVEDWEWGPGEKIYGDTESSVEILRPDTTALNADFQIDRIQLEMEEFAGAPRQAMGFRTPGEKTAFEVSALENAAGRIFQNKIQHFENVFIEPLLNQMLEAARRNINTLDVAAVQDDDFGAVEFLRITPEDITARGKLVPIGARHFARSNQLAANLFNFVNSAAYADPSVATHISGLVIATAAQELLGLDRLKMVSPDVRITEQLQSQRLLQSAQTDVAVEGTVDPALAAEEVDEEEGLA